MFQFSLLYPGRFVKDSIRRIESLWIGLGLAIIVAVLFLRSLKANLVILFTIPVCFSP
jgi:multidrug efflux pump subunit AcrB